MSIKSERAWEKLWKGKQLQAKIRQLEEDYNDYRILAQTKIRQLEDETQRLKSEMRWRRDETSI